jgi:hypothetical protein
MQCHAIVAVAVLAHLHQAAQPAPQQGEFSHVLHASGRTPVRSQQNWGLTPGIAATPRRSRTGRARSGTFRKKLKLSRKMFQVGAADLLPAPAFAKALLTSSDGELA